MKDWKKKIKNIYFVGQYPDTDWQRLLALFIIVGFFMALWSFYYYYATQNEVFIVDSVSGAAHTEAQAKQAEVENVLNVYNTKEKTYQSLLPAGVSDTLDATTTGN